MKPISVFWGFYLYILQYILMLIISGLTVIALGILSVAVFNIFSNFLYHDFILGVECAVGVTMFFVVLVAGLGYWDKIKR